MAPSDRQKRMCNSDGYAPSREAGHQVEHLKDLQQTACGDSSRTHRRQVGRSDLSTQRVVAAEVHNPGGGGTVLSARWPAEQTQGVGSWHALTQANPWERGAVRLSASGEEDANVTRAIAAARGHRSSTSRNGDVRNARLKEIESQFRQLRVSQRQPQGH